MNATYTYDKLNQLTNVTIGGDTTTYGYDENGNIVNKTTGALVTTYSYNNGNMLTEIDTKQSGVNRYNYTSTYYLDGNRKYVTDSQSYDYWYEYDGRGQLKHEGQGNYDYYFTYDAYGNRTKKVHDGPWDRDDVEYTYDANNRLVKAVNNGYNNTDNYDYTQTSIYGYDANGNQTYYLDGRALNELAYGEESVQLGILGENNTAGGMVKMYTYNGFGQRTGAIVDGTTAEYVYNPDGLRVSKTVNGTTTTHILDGANVVADVKKGNVAKYNRGGELISIETGGQKGYYIFNGHGDVAKMVTAEGVHKSRTIYNAYGEYIEYYGERDTTDSLGGLNNPFGYAGEYTDLSSGLIYLRNRYYDPNIGRFISEDPAKAGSNWYVYANNNPIMYIDPLGEDAIIVTNSEAALKQGHTSAIYQDANGDWFYTYWGNKAAAVIRIPNEYMGTLDDFNKGLNKFLADNGFKDITSNYNSSTYIVGDFTASLDAAYADVRGAHSNSFHKDSKTHELDDGSVVFQGQNSPYNLSWNNCLDRTYDSLSKGTLSNGTNAGTHMKNLGFKGGLRPNNATSKFDEVFMNSSFTYGGAYSALLNYATLYVQGSSWAQKWEKANYANSVIGW